MKKTLTLIYGIHAVESLLRSGAEVSDVYVLKARHDERITSLLAQATQKSARIHLVEKHVLDDLSKEGSHQGIVAQTPAKPVATGSEGALVLLATQKTSPLFLLLDGVQDPHNLGACLRSAYAFGVDAVIVPKDRSVGLTPVVKKVACGAAEHIAFFQVTNLVRTMKTLSEAGVWFYGAEAGSHTTLPSCKLSGAVAWVLGGEGEGLRDQTKKACDFLVTIPMKNPIDSLNVSVACGICLYATRVYSR